MRILVVDDDQGFRATLRHLLTEGHPAVEVHEAADGEEAVRLVPASRPDVVLMDITMPRLNGVESTRRLKAQWPELPVIILTVHDDPLYERTARAAGADGFLVKKTAGTTLWPALLPFLGGGAPGGPGPEPAGPRSAPETGPAGSRAEAPPPGAVGLDPRWRAAARPPWPRGEDRT